MLNLVALFLLLFVSSATAASLPCNAYYVRWPRVRLNFKSVANARLSLRACESACSLGEDPQLPGRSLECAALNHHPAPDGFAHQCDVFQPHQLQNVDGYVEADDRYSFFWKYCLNSSRRCGGEYAFTYLSDRYMDSRDVIRVTKKNSLEECLVECLDERSIPCRSISFNRTDGGCHVSGDSQLTKPKAIRLNNNPNFRIDYYENNCYNLSDTFKFDQECREDGIFVKVKSKFPYTGALYGLYDFFTCRIEPKEMTEFGLLFPSPTASKNCSDSIRFQGDEMVLDVVLSTDGIEPLYFITPDDLTYQAKCPIVGKTNKAVANTLEEGKQEKFTTEFAPTNSNAPARTTPLKTPTSNAKLFRQTYPLPLITAEETQTPAITDIPFKQVVQQVIRAHLAKSTWSDENLLSGDDELLDEKKEEFLAQIDPPAESIRTKFQAPIVELFAKLTTDGDARDINESITPSYNQIITSNIINVTNPSDKINELFTGNAKLSTCVSKANCDDHTITTEPGPVRVTVRAQQIGSTEINTTSKIDEISIVESSGSQIEEGSGTAEITVTTVVPDNEENIRDFGIASTIELFDDDVKDMQLHMAPKEERTTFDVQATTKIPVIILDGTGSQETLINLHSDATSAAIILPSTTVIMTSATSGTSFITKHFDSSESTTLPSRTEILSSTINTMGVTATEGTSFITKHFDSSESTTLPSRTEILSSTINTMGVTATEGTSNPHVTVREQEFRGFVSGPQSLQRLMIKKENISSELRAKNHSHRSVIKKSHLEFASVQQNKLVAVEPAKETINRDVTLSNAAVTQNPTETKAAIRKTKVLLSLSNKKSSVAPSATLGAKTAASTRMESNRRVNHQSTNTSKTPKPSLVKEKQGDEAKKNSGDGKLKSVSRQSIPPMIPRNSSPPVMTKVVKTVVRLHKKKHGTHPRGISLPQQGSGRQTRRALKGSNQMNKGSLFVKKTSNRRFTKPKRNPRSKKSDFFLRRQSLVIPIKMTTPTSAEHLEVALRATKMPTIPKTSNRSKSSATFLKENEQSKRAIEGVKIAKIQQREAVPVPHNDFFGKPKLMVKDGVVQRVGTKDQDPLDELVPLLESSHLSQRMITLLKLLAASMENAKKQHLVQRRERKRQHIQRKQRRRSSIAQIRRHVRGKFRREMRIPLRPEQIVSPKTETVLKQQLKAFSTKLSSSLQRNKDSRKKTILRRTTQKQSISSTLQLPIVENSTLMKENNSPQTQLALFQRQPLSTTATSVTTFTKHHKHINLAKGQTSGKQSKPRRALRAPSTVTSPHSFRTHRPKTTTTTRSTAAPSTTTIKLTTSTTLRPSSTTTTTEPTTATKKTSTRGWTTTQRSTTTPTTTSTTTAKAPLNRSPVLHTAGPPAPTKPTEPTKPVKGSVSFDIFHNGQPVEAVVVGTKITLSFAPLYAIPPEYMSVQECQVEPIDSKYEWEREPLPIIREGCQADLVGLVCPPKQSEFGVKVSVEAFRYQSTPHVQYSCLVRICPFAPCPPASCAPVDGCPRDKRAARSLSLEEIRRALEADPKLASQIGISPHVLANRPGHSVESQLLALGGDHTVKRRLVVVNSEDQLRYYVRTGDVP
ncbi:hypothetical protein RB195_002168 [Necator americanus]|uniref:Apple domain-containing protein n=1 Tax=Necator americanus TaxID=51031 RepID=A0ABR1DHQ7_NECAM